MWPFKKKPTPVLSCVAQSILKDLSELPFEEWTFTESKGICNRCYQTFSHPKVKYSLFTRLYDEKDCYVSIIEIRLNVLSEFDKKTIWNKLRWIEYQKDKAKLAAIKKEDEKQLKEYFPQCFEK